MTSDLARQSNSNSDPVDFALLRGLEIDVADGDPEIMLDLIDIFLNDSKEHLVGIHQALAEGSYQQIEISVHSLKSSAATFGALTLSHYCGRLEQLIRARQLEEVPALLTAAQEEFSRVEPILVAERQRWQEVLSE